MRARPLLSLPAVIDSVFQDLRYAARSLARQPRYTLAALFTLTLGIGVNAAIYSVVNAVLVRPLPYAEADRLAMVWGSRGGDIEPVSPADFVAWRSDGRFFEGLGATSDATYSLTGAGDPESIPGYRFSVDAFSVLGVRPMLGRTFLPEEDRPGGEPVVVLSDRLWKRRFAQDPNVLGTAIMLNGKSHVIIGVMPPGFRQPQHAELWTPLALDPAILENRRRRFLRVLARLRPGVEIPRAETGLNELMKQREQQFPDSNTGLASRVESLRERYTGDVKPALLMLLGAVGFVLLMVCANVAHLSLARASGRRKELAIRTALGAARGRLMRQLLTESLLLSTLGGVLGVLIAYTFAGTLVSLFPTEIANLNVPVVTEIPFDWRVILFAVGVTLASGLMFGLVPALQATRAAIGSTLQETPRGSGGGGAGRRLRSLLVIAETATALVLLAGAGLTIRSFMQLQRGDLGLDPDHVLTAQVFLTRARHADAAAWQRFTEETLKRLESLPGVESAGATSFLPLTGFQDITSFRIVGQAPPAEGQEPTVDYRYATPGYFRTVGMRILRGRGFTADDRSRSPCAAVVNETLARRFFPSQDALGQRLDLGKPSEPYVCEIVGLVNDVHSFGLEQEVHAELFLPLSNAPSPFAAFTLRTATPPMALADAVRRAIWEVDRDQPIHRVMPFEQLAMDTLTLRRVSVLLMGFFAGLAILLSAIGVYGVVSCMVGQRTTEIGIRLALGAPPGDVARMIVSQGMRPVLAGLALGLAGAYGVTRLVSGLVYGTAGADPAAYAAALLVLLAAGVTASYLPARRATRIDPIAVLKQE